MTVPAVEPAAPATTASFAFHGVEIEVEGDVVAATAALRASFGAFVTGPTLSEGRAQRFSVDRAGDGFRVTEPSGASTRVPTEQAAVIRLFDRVVRSVVDGLAANGILAIHAGVVEVDGRAWLLAGPSGSGKSTLTLAMMRYGAGWLTDELALIAADGLTVLPFPRSLHVRPQTVLLLPTLRPYLTRPRYDLGGGSEWSVSPDDVRSAFGARVAGPTPLGGIVLLDGVPDADRAPRLEPVGPAAVAMGVARGAPAAAVEFEPTVGRLLEIADRVRRVRLQAGELDATARALAVWMMAT